LVKDTLDYDLKPTPEMPKQAQ